MREKIGKTEEQHQQANAMPVKFSPVHQRALDSFDSLPGSAGVPVPVAGAVLTVSGPTVWRRIKDGTLEVVRVGGSTRVTVASIRRAMAGDKPARMAAVTAASVAARAASKNAPFATAEEK
jgi:hypothetical protein